MSQRMRKKIILTKQMYFAKINTCDKKKKQDTRVEK